MSTSDKTKTKTKTKQQLPQSPALLQTKLIAFGLFVRGYSSQLSSALETAASLDQLEKHYSAQWEKAGSRRIKSRPDQLRRMYLF